MGWGIWIPMVSWHLFPLHYTSICILEWWMCFGNHVVQNKRLPWVVMMPITRLWLHAVWINDNSMVISGLMAKNLTSFDFLILICFLQLWCMRTTSPQRNKCVCSSCNCLMHALWTSKATPMGCCTPHQFSLPNSVQLSWFNFGCQQLQNGKDNIFWMHSPIFSSVGDSRLWTRWI